MLTFLMGEDDHNMWHNKNTSRIDVYTSHDPAVSAHRGNCNEACSQLTIRVPFRVLACST